MYRGFLFGARVVVVAGVCWVGNEVRRSVSSDMGVKGCMGETETALPFARTVEVGGESLELK